MKIKQTVKGPDGLKIHFDGTDADTPAMVEVGRHTATFYCALETGEMDCGAGPDLTDAQLKFLAEYERCADDYTNLARKNDPRFA